MLPFINLDLNNTQRNFINKLMLIDRSDSQITIFKSPNNHTITNQNEIKNNDNFLLFNKDCDGFDYVIEEVF